jgi:hypothetical protein
VASDRLDAVTDVTAILGLVAVASTTAADPTTVVLAIAGLGGYRMRRSAVATRRQSEPRAAESGGEPER